jgi:hypothetical protein
MLWLSRASAFIDDLQALGSVEAYNSSLQLVERDKYTSVRLPQGEHQCAEFIPQGDYTPRGCGKS